MNKDLSMREAVIKSIKTLYRSLPVLIGVILLISLINALLPKTFFVSLFKGNLFLDSFTGSLIGSILAGNPVTSYIIGGELLKQGVSLVAVTSFLVAWVTVGIVQLPAESVLLGKKFAITRNIVSFIFSMIVAVIAVSIFGLI